MEHQRRSKIVDLLKSSDFGKEVLVKGWVRTRRGSKNVNFVALNDGSVVHHIQVVVDGDKFTEEFMKPITTGSAIAVKGTLVQSPGRDNMLRSMLQRLRCTERQIPKHTRCRRKDIRLNFSGRSLTFVPGPTLLGQFCGSAMPWPLPFINILTTMVFITCIPRSSPDQMQKVPGPCSVYQLLMRKIRR